MPVQMLTRLDLKDPTAVTYVTPPEYLPLAGLGCVLGEFGRVATDAFAVLIASLSS